VTGDFVFVLHIFVLAVERGGNLKCLRGHGVHRVDTHFHNVKV